MNINRYTAVIAAADMGTLSAAAASLGYTQPALSHILESMEKEYGFHLFDRTNRGVVPTDECRRLLPLFRRISETEIEIGETVRRLNEVNTGHIRIMAFLSIMLAWIPDVIGIMKERYPGLEITVLGSEPGDQVNLLKNNAADISLGTALDPTFCRFLPLCDDPAVAMLPPGHPLCAREFLTAEDLLTVPLIIQPDPEAGELKTILGERLSHVTPTCVVKYDPAIARLVSAGLGIGVTSGILGRRETEVEIRPFDRPYARTLGVVVPRSHAMTAADSALIGLLRELYQEEKYKNSRLR